MRSSHVLDRMAVTFDDEHAVASAGLILSGTLAGRLGIEELADELIDLGDKPGAHRPGRKVMTLIHSVVVGGDCIDDADVPRVGSTGMVLGHRVRAPSTLGTFLRSFTFGHVRQLDRLAEAVLTRAWAAGAGPGDAAMTFDVEQVAALLRQHVLGPRRVIGVLLPDEDAELHQPIEAGGQNRASDPEAAVEVLEAGDSLERVSHDQHRLGQT